MNGAVVVFVCLGFFEYSWEFRIFHFLYIMAKRRKLTKGCISKLSNESEGKCKKSHLSKSANDHGETDCISEISSYESLDDNILNEFIHTQRSLCGRARPYSTDLSSPPWLPGLIVLTSLTGWLCAACLLPHSSCVCPEHACSVQEACILWLRRPLFHKGHTNSCAALQTCLWELMNEQCISKTKEKYSILRQLFSRRNCITVFCMNLNHPILIKDTTLFFHLLQCLCTKLYLVQFIGGKMLKTDVCNKVIRKKQMM